jgi:hypothetical protein
MMVTHKGETMHATLSFAYPDDEQKLKDALAGESYRIALERIQDLVNENAGMTYKLTAIKTMVNVALEGEL